MKDDEGREMMLRPETPEDDAFERALFASTRAAELGFIAGGPTAQGVFVHIQFEAQRRAYSVSYPAADRSIIVIAGASAGRLIVDRAGDDIRLVDIALLPEHRGKGAGTRVLLGLLDEARAAGRAVTLHVRKTNPAARLYARLGFVRAGGTEMDDAMEWRQRERRSA